MKYKYTFLTSANILSSLFSSYNIYNIFKSKQKINFSKENSVTTNQEILDIISEINTEYSNYLEKSDLSGDHSFIPEDIN